MEERELCFLFKSQLPRLQTIVYQNSEFRSQTLLYLTIDQDFPKNEILIFEHYEKAKKKLNILVLCL